jgi:hypothetical protein
MLRTQSALISLTLLSTLGSGSEAQVRERVFRPATTTTTPTTTTARPPGMVDPEEKMMLRRFLAGPANLSVTGTPAMASLRWDTLPGAIGYNVSRSDPAGTTVRLTPGAITPTSYQDQSGGIKPGNQYRYHVTAAYPDDGAGTAEVSFTPPPAAVAAWAQGRAIHRPDRVGVGARARRRRVSDHRELDATGPNPHLLDRLFPGRHRIHGPDRIPDPIRLSDPDPRGDGAAVIAAAHRGS